MHIEVSTDNSIDGSAGLTRLIEDSVQHELAHLESHITRIEVHLSEVHSASTSQNEKHCMIEARPKGLQPTVAKDSGATVEQAVKGAASKLKSSLESTLGKLSDSR